MTDYSDLVQRLRTDLVQRLRSNPVKWSDSKEAANVIELLQRELKCANELWEQQKELALEYLADIEKANERIAEIKHDTVCHEAADVIEAQAKRIAELEAALKPFDEMLQRDFSIMSDDERYDDDFTAKVLMRLGDLRAARKVLENGDDNS